jgi:hypothetical protein
MSQFLLSVWHDGEYPTPAPEVLEQMFAQVGAFNDDLAAAGAMVFGGGLLPKSTANVTRSGDDGSVAWTAGPFSPVAEQMGGFWIIDVTDLDTANEWAAKGAAACLGCVEVRAFQGE